MPRPRKRRRIQGMPQSYFYKPQGVPLRHLEIIEVSLEEFEALRLKNIEELQQIACAKKMNISQSTFQRILFAAQKKISHAIVHGKAIRIEKK